MPETRPNPSPVIAMAMAVSAITLILLAVLIYTGVVPIGEDVRTIASLVVGAAAFVDFVIAIWFFRKSQSS